MIINSIKVELIQQKDRTIVEQVVEIHMKAFSGFFLTFLGKGFLKQLYLGYLENKNSGIFVARNSEDKVVGFLAFSNNLSDLYKSLIKKRIVLFAWYGLLATIKNPKAMKRLLGAFLKPGESVRTEKYCELASIGVDPEYGGYGIGSLLINALKAKVDFSKIEYITLETDSVDNDKANDFYKKNGFILFRTFETPEGRQMNEYRYIDKGDIA